MTANRVRFVELERAEIDPETGEFPMILATDGEASDGDILSIDGAQFSSRAPLQLSHVNDPTATLGSVSGFRRDMTGTPKKLRARGQIELTGEGPTADIRRDVAHMIKNGHVTGISVRWQPIKYTARASLPKDHPAYVKENEPNWIKRNGRFHERWQLLEGSIVAIQSDREAMIGRALVTEGPVSQFWRAMADEAQPREAIEAQGIEQEHLAPPSEPAVGDDAPLTIRDMGEFVGDLAKIVKKTVDERIAEAMTTTTTNTTAEPAPETGALLDRISSLERKLQELEEGRESRDPAPRLTPERLVRIIEDGLDEKKKNVLAAVEAFVVKRQGKVSHLESLRDQAVAEATAVISERLGIKPPKPETAKQPATMSELTQRLNDEFEKASVRFAKRIESAD